MGARNVVRLAASQWEETTDFGTALMAIRRELNLSQSALGRRVGLSGPQLSRVENGKRTPPAKRTFYEGLRRAGASEEMISHLLSLPDSPAKVLEARAPSPGSLSLKIAEQDVTVSLAVDAEPGTATPGELVAAGALASMAVSYALQDFRRIRDIYRAQAEATEKIANTVVRSALESGDKDDSGVHRQVREFLQSGDHDRDDMYSILPEIVKDFYDRRWRENPGSD